MMKWLLVFAAVLVACAAQHTPKCTGDHNCGDDEYCTIKEVCMQCNNCTKYNMKSIPGCVKSILDCTGCLPGYVLADKESVGCVVPGVPPPVWLWVLLAVLVLVLCSALAFLAWHVLRNQNNTSFHPRALWGFNNRNSPTAPPHEEYVNLNHFGDEIKSVTNGILNGQASLPLLNRVAAVSPPPYSTVVDDHTINTPGGGARNHDSEDQGLPLKAEQTDDGMRCAHGTRESDATQKARKYHEANYPEDDTSNALVTCPNCDQPEWLQDENTMESTWTPQPQHSNPGPADAQLANTNDQSSRLRPGRVRYPPEGDSPPRSRRRIGQDSPRVVELDDRPEENPLALVVANGLPATQSTANGGSSDQTLSIHISAKIAMTQKN